MDTTTTTPEELREQADLRDRQAAESFDRCDTDGFMSQWASGLTARKLRLEADLIENGGRAMFPALFDTDGNLVPAKYVTVRRGYRHDYAWGLLADDDPHGRFVGWFNPSNARTKGTARRNDAKKGYYVGYVMAPAKATIRANGTGMAGAASATVGPDRTDGGFSRDVVVFDNGHGDTDVHHWYDIQDGTWG
jgi:hypothetical protein